MGVPKSGYEEVELDFCQSLLLYSIKTSNTNQRIDEEPDATCKKAFAILFQGDCVDLAPQNWKVGRDIAVTWNCKIGGNKVRCTTSDRKSVV